MVIGHEIGHVAALHGVQMIQKEMGQNALTILGTIGTAVVAGPEAMILVANTANLFSSLYLLGYSREKELEADNLGLQYMLRAGYDPRGALRFFKKLQAGETEKAKGWDLYFRTHPSTEERISIIESMVGRDDTSRDTPEQKKVYQDIKAQLPRIDMSERGVINGTTYQNGPHELTFSVLPNWSLGFFRPQALVAFQTFDRNAEGRLQVVRLSSATENAEHLAERFAKDQGFQLITGHEVLYPAGYGYLGRYFGASPGGAGHEIRLYTTIRRHRGYVFFCGAPMEKPEIYILDIERIMRSLKFS
jgi:predicted Zn-dependent protease